MSPQTSKVYIGADHAGFSTKKFILEHAREQLPDIEMIDLGCDSEAAVDYPAYAKKVAEQVRKDGARGILICGSGIGMSIVANKVKGIRAVAAWDVTSSRLSIEHNNANVLCLGGRLFVEATIWEIVQVWLTAEFQGGRHAKRISLIDQMEEEWR